MAGALLENVERQTRLAGHNRVAMLLFRLGDAQLFGINVFKVREVLRRPPLERMPGAHALIAGSCDYRGQTIPVIDLAAALGYPALLDEPSAHLMVTEFSRSVQGFLVSDLSHMVHCEGESLVAPKAFALSGFRSMTRWFGGTSSRMSARQRSFPTLRRAGRSIPKPRRFGPAKFVKA